MAIERIGVWADREFGEFLREIVHCCFMASPRNVVTLQKGDVGPCGWDKHIPEYHPVTREQFVAACLGKWWPEDPEPEHPTTFEDRWGKTHCIQYESPDLVRFGCQLVTRGLIESVLNHMNYLRGKENE